MGPVPQDTPLPSLWRRLDDGVYVLERAVVVLATGLMVVLVFLSVVWRLFAAPSRGVDPGFVQDVLLGLPGKLLVWSALCVFAMRTARRQDPLWRVFAIGVGVAVGTTALSFLFVYLLPSGLIFSQRLALGLMMWVILLGCSMAARDRRHIMIQAAQKIIPERLLRAHAALSLVAAAGFTAFLWYVSSKYALENLRDWYASDMESGVFESIALPYWAVTSAVPVGFGLTSLRFLSQAFCIWRGTLPPLPPTGELQAAASHEVEESAG